MRRLLSPGKLLLAGGLLAVITLGVLWLAPSGDYLLLPDEAHPVAPLVTVEKPKRGGGKDGIYFVDLLQRRATLLESMFPSIRDGATLVPEDRVNPHGIAESVRRQADLGQMARSQEIAAAVALDELGYDVKVRENGAFVASVYSDLPALGKVVPGEVIVAVDGKPVRSTIDLQRLIGERPPGTTLTLTLRGSDRRRNVRLTTVANPADETRSVIGVLVEPAADIRLPLDVSIDAGNIGGPVGRARVRARRHGEARTRRRRRPEGRRDGRALARRLGAPDRRHQAEDDRRAGRGRGRLPRAGRECRRGESARRRAEDRAGAVRRAGRPGPCEAPRGVLVARNEYAGNSGKSVAHPSCILSRGA